MASNLPFFDGDFGVATPASPRRKTYPFAGDTDSFYFEQDFVQLFSHFEPLTPSTPYPAPELEHAYLVEETPLQDLGGGVGRWTRVYSVIPNSRVEQESFAYTIPGIAPDPFLILRTIVSGSNSGSITTITTTYAHTFAVGDTIQIAYTVQQATPKTLFHRAVTRQILTVPTSTTFTVDLIQDIATPTYSVVFKNYIGRKPFSKVVPSFVHFDYFLPGVSAGIDTAAAIPILNLTPITIFGGDVVDSYSVITTPTLATYRASIAAGNMISAPVFRQVVTPVITYDYAPQTYVTNLVERPFVSTALKATGGAPFPFAGTAGLLLTTLYSGYAAIRNKKTAKALVLGIEAGREFLNSTPEGQKLDARFRDELIKHQEAAGVLNAVCRLVNAHTGNTVA